MQRTALYTLSRRHRCVQSHSPYLTLRTAILAQRARILCVSSKPMVLGSYDGAGNSNRAACTALSTLPRRHRCVPPHSLYCRVATIVMGSRNRAARTAQHSTLHATTLQLARATSLPVLASLYSVPAALTSASPAASARVISVCFQDLRYLFFGGERHKYLLG